MTSKILWVAMILVLALIFWGDRWSEKAYDCFAKGGTKWDSVFQQCSKFERLKLN